MPRADAFGFVWEDSPAVRVKGERRELGPRPLPAIPENGWKPKAFPRLDKARIIGLDTETKDVDLLEKGPGVRRPGNHIVGISVATEDNKSWYFPIRHELGENLPVENVIKWAKDNLTRPNQPKVGTNLLYDLDFLAEEGVNVTGPFHDVQVAEALLDENARGYDLESLSMRYLKIGKTTAELEDWLVQAYGDRNFRANIYRAPSQLVGPYAETDALNPIRILEKQLIRLKAEKLLPLWEIESGQAQALLAMRRRGVRIDLKHAEHVEGRLEELLKTSTKRLNDAAGFEVNIGSGAHLVRLFDGLGLKYPKTAPSKRFPEGQASFVKEFLEHHAHPLPKLITEIRGWTKFRDTFVRGYIYDLHIKGRIHCQFNQTVTDEYGAVSGRYSSSNPNLQNIPWRDPLWGPLIRSIFLPEVGEDWGRHDWSQIEYRILVHLANHYLNGGFGSAEAVAKYNNDPTTDYHEYVASVTKVARKIAKNLNFGLVYGMGVPLLAHQIGISVEEATPMFKQYHEALPFVDKIRKHVSNAAASQGYVTTLLGRRRRFDLWEPRFSNDAEKPIALRLEAATSKWGHRLRRAHTHKALNAEIQGTAADLMKKMIYDYSKRSDLIAVLGYPLLIVHDEYDESVPRTKIAKEAFFEMKRMMENTLKLSVPVIADAKLAKNWGEAA